MGEVKSGKYVGSLGSVKQAPINMKKDEHQFAIDGYLVDEVLKQIPPQIKIIQAQVFLMKREPDIRIAIPNALRKHGVQYIRKQGTLTTCTMTLDAINKQDIKHKVTEACKALNLPYQKAYFQYIVLAHGNATCKFAHCTKEQRPDTTDQRKKLRVLGAVEGQGPVQSLIAGIGAKKMKCTYKEVVVKVMMCSRD